MLSIRLLLLLSEDLACCLPMGLCQWSCGQGQPSSVSLGMLCREDGGAIPCKGFLIHLLVYKVRVGREHTKERKEHRPPEQGLVREETNDKCSSKQRIKAIPSQWGPQSCLCLQGLRCPRTTAAAGCLHAKKERQ